MKRIISFIGFLAASAVAFSVPANVQTNGVGGDLTNGFSTGAKTITVSATGTLAVDSSATVTGLLKANGNGSSLTGLTKSQVGLGNVDNTSDLNKPVSTATQTEIDSEIDRATSAEDGKANLVNARLLSGGDGKNIIFSAPININASTLTVNAADSVTVVTGSNQFWRLPDISILPGDSFVLSFRAVRTSGAGYIFYTNSSGSIPSAQGVSEGLNSYTFTGVGSSIDYVVFASGGASQWTFSEIRLYRIRPADLRFPICELNQIIAHGQSNSIGATSASVWNGSAYVDEAGGPQVVITPWQPYQNLQFIDQFATLTPLVSPPTVYYGNRGTNIEGETPLPALTAQLSRDTLLRYVASTTGFAAKPIGFLNKPRAFATVSAMNADLNYPAGTLAKVASPLAYYLKLGNYGTGSWTTTSAPPNGEAPWDWILTTTQAGKDRATEIGSTHAVPFIPFIQGESDANFVIPGDSQFVSSNYYTEKLIELYGDLATAIPAITGQAEKPIMLIDQVAFSADRINNGHFYVNQNQWLAHQLRPEIVIVSPRYAYTSAIHYTADGQRWFGSQLAKVAYKIGTLGEQWRPVQPVAWKVIGSTVRVRFHVPVMPLQFSTNSATGGNVDEILANKGFEISDSNGRTITSVEIVGGNELLFTLSGAPASDAVISYVKGNRYGNLCDSDTFGAYYGNAYGPYDLRNWCVVHSIALSTVTNWDPIENDSPANAFPQNPVVQSVTAQSVRTQSGNLDLIPASGSVIRPQGQVRVTRSSSDLIRQALIEYDAAAEQVNIRGRVEGFEGFIFPTLVLNSGGGAVKVAPLTTNGYVKTGSSDGTLSVSSTVAGSDVSGAVPTATALATARTINGVSFDGTANINCTDEFTTVSTPTTGSTLTGSATVGTELLEIEPAGTIAALTINLESADALPIGTVKQVAMSQIITALTINPSGAGGGSINGTAVTAGVVNGSYAFKKTASKTWRRLY